MKIILLILLPVSLFSQVEILNNSLINPKARIVYIGVDNNLSLSGMDISKVEIYTTNGFLANGTSPGTWILKCSKKSADTLTLKKNGKIIYKQVMDVKSVPFPEIRLGSSKGITSKSKIAADPQLRVILPDCLLKVNLAVIQFDVDIDEEGIISGYRLTKNQLSLISQMKSGSKLTFTQLKAQGPENIALSFPDLIITVK